MQTHSVSHTEKYQTLQLFRMEDIIISLDDRVASATGVIMDLFEERRPVVVATSFGKDSSVVMSIVMNAARDFAAAGGKPLVVATSSNTLVENPEVHAMAREEMGKLHGYAKKHDIRFFGKFVTPQLLSTFQVKILSGRGIPSWASGGNDCTVDLKITAQKSYRKKLFRTIAEKGMPEPVTCLGMRIQESEVRAARMRQSGARAETPVRNKDGELVLCPVSYLRTSYQSLNNKEQLWNNGQYAELRPPSPLCFPVGSPLIQRGQKSFIATACRSCFPLSIHGQ